MTGDGFLMAEIFHACAQERARVLVAQTRRVFERAVVRCVGLQRGFLRFELVDLHVELLLRVFEPFAVDGEPLTRELGHVVFVLVHFHLHRFVVDRTAVERERTKQRV